MIGASRDSWLDTFRASGDYHLDTCASGNGLRRHRQRAGSTLIWFAASINPSSVTVSRRLLPTLVPSRWSHEIPSWSVTKDNPSFALGGDSNSVAMFGNCCTWSIHFRPTISRGLLSRSQMEPIVRRNWLLLRSQRGRSHLYHVVSCL